MGFHWHCDCFELSSRVLHSLTSLYCVNFIILYMASFRATSLVPETLRKQVKICVKSPSEHVRPGRFIKYPMKRSTKMVIDLNFNSYFTNWRGYTMLYSHNLDKAATSYYILQSKAKSLFLDISLMRDISWLPS